jgi:light-regulated signal transduction histidine kinase (bacteriophytochrome)
MAEPIKEGLNAHLKRVDGLIKELNDEIVGLQRIEKALKDAHSRLDRQGGLIVMETHLIESLIKHDKPDKPAVPLKSVPMSSVADKVEADLAQLITDNQPPRAVK